jgi:hypothetical protein
MSATVICFESFRIERDRRRAVPFLREPGVALTPRQIAHRQTMLDYWNERGGPNESLARHRLPALSVGFDLESRTGVDQIEERPQLRSHASLQPATRFDE